MQNFRLSMNNSVESQQSAGINLRHKMASRCSRSIHCILDVLCFFIVALVDLFFHVLPIKPAHRGFFCDDESIRKPFQSETVPNWAAIVAGLLVTTLTILTCESLRQYVFKIPEGDLSKELNFDIKVGPIKLKAWQRRMVFILFMFGFGCIVTNLFTDLGKATIGRLRPYFLAVCKPNISRLNCTELGFITDIDICTGDPTEIQEARVSFPSGHSSFSAYTMVFLVLYIEATVPAKKSNLVKPFFQITALVFALFVSLSRVYDFWHHWGDVLTGLILGTAVAVFIAFKPLQLFPRTRPPICRCQGQVHPNVSVDALDQLHVDVERDTTVPGSAEHY